MLYILVSMTEEHCHDQSSLLIVIETSKIGEDSPLKIGQQVSFKNPKNDGHSSGWIVTFFSKDQDGDISGCLARHHGHI